MEPTILGSHKACGNVMRGVFWAPDRILFFCLWCFLNIADHLVSWDNPDGNRNINLFELSGNYSQATLVAPRTTLLAFSASGCNIFSTISWVKCSSILQHSPAAAFPHARALLLWEHHILGCVGLLPGKVNSMADAASHI